MNNMLSMDKKLELWEESLPKDKVVLIAYAVQKEVNEIVDEKMIAINQALTSTISAVLYELYKFNTEEIQEIIKKSNEYMKESEIFLSKYKEDWIMKINELKPDVEAMSQTLLEKDLNQAESIKALKDKFTNIPTKDLVNIYKETKEDWCAKCAELTEEDRKTIKARNKAQIDKKKISNVITPKEETKSSDKATGIKNNAFEVVSKEITLKGKYGTYKVNKENVQVGELKFNNLIDIEEYRKKELEEFQKQIDEFNSHVEEIKAAFSYM